VHNHFTGGIVSPSLLQFIEALFSGKLISPASLEQMKTIQDKYGMGLFKYRFMIK
jgi:hypothetical protein